MLPLVALALYNFSQDYYGVFLQRQEWRGVVPNERYLKYEAVLQRAGDIRLLLFGSSRAANIPFYRSLGEGAYNFAYSEGLPRDHLQVLEKLVDELPALETVYIAVDDMSYLLDPAPHARDFLRRQHPAVAGIPEAWFKLRYLLRPLSNVDYLYFFGDRRARPAILYELDTSGRSLCPQCDRDIDADPVAHRAQAFFRLPYAPPERYGIDRLLGDIRSIRDLLDARSVELVILLQPTFLNNLRWHNLAMLEQLKRAIAGVAPFYDFLVYDGRLVDETNFYDVIHFRPNIGQKIMEVLTGASVPAPGEFGFLVQENALAHHSALVRGRIVGRLIPEQRYLQDSDYATWYAAHGYPRSPLPEREGSSLLGIRGEDVNCHLDSAMRKRFVASPIRVALENAEMLEVGGWGRLDTAGMQGFLRLAGDSPLSSDAVFEIAAGMRRQDVARVHGAQFLRTGFRGNVNIGELDRGNYRLSLLFGEGVRSGKEAGSDWFECGNDIRLVIF